MIGAFTEFDILKTAEMARGLQPEARHLFVIGGSSEFDRWWLATARADLAAFSKDYDTTYLEDLTIDEFTRRAAELPRDSIVLALTIFKDRSGRNFIPREAIRQIAETASAPIYGPYPTYIDYGIVGGNVVTFEALGMTVADLALDAIAGKPISNLEVSPNLCRRCEATEALGVVGGEPSSGHRSDVQRSDLLGAALACHRRGACRDHAPGHRHCRTAYRTPPPPDGGDRSRAVASSKWFISISLRQLARCPRRSRTNSTSRSVPSAATPRRRRSFFGPRSPTSS